MPLIPEAALLSRAFFSLALFSNPPQIMTRKLNPDNSTNTIKFLYSYGGRIVPRPTDGKLRYAGGMTRILSVDRSISYMELAVKFVEACGVSMSLRCKLPTDDLDVLVSVTYDEDLANVIQVYERTNQDLKIRAILNPIKPVKEISPPPSPVIFSTSKPPKFPGPIFNLSAAKPAKYPVAGFYSPPSVTSYRRCAPKVAAQGISSSQNQYVPRWFNYRL